MIFNSFSFIFAFLPITLTGYFLLSRKSTQWAAVWLTLASLLFYSWWDYHYLPLLLGSILFNYWTGWRIAHAIQPSRKRWLILAITVNLLLLGYFKYADFFILSINSMTGGEIPALKVILPVGISFFTFTQIAFLVDTYQDKVKEFRFIHYSLFVTYFPHLIAGPVLHHKEMMPQFADDENYKLKAENFAVGTAIFILGLTKKVLIADNLSPLVAPVFSGYNPQFVEAWLGLLAYSLQLYFDFSGYSDMAIGLSRLMGVKLPLNFNSPYKATSISEFWQRWHMSLSRFLRDYLYIPLGGNRHGAFNRYRNLLLTMLLGGLWHGANWTFVIWGGLHGLYLCINHSWQFLMTKTTKPLVVMPNFLAGMLTFFAVLVGWCFFRAPDVSTALNVLAGMAGQHGISLAVDVNTIGHAIIVLGAFIVFCMPNTQELFLRYDPCYDKINPLPSLIRISWSPTLLWSLIMALLFVMCVLNMNRVSEFLYFQF